MLVSFIAEDGICTKINAFAAFGSIQREVAMKVILREDRSRITGSRRQAEWRAEAGVGAKKAVLFALFDFGHSFSGR